jgi:hypothetical protein
MEKLKKDIDGILEEHAEKGIKDCKTLEIVKTALSAKSKILTIEAMERVNEEGFSRGRRANGQFMDSDGGNYGRMYRDESGEYQDGSYRDGGNYSRSYRDSGREYLQKMLQHAEPREREVIEKMLRKL